MKYAKRMTCVAWILAGATPWGLAQTSPPPTPEESSPSVDEQVIVVVPLAHVQCEQVSNGLNRLKFRLRSSCASSANVILRGKADEVEKVRDQVIPLIDIPEATAHLRGNAFIPLGHRPSEDLLNLVDTVVTGEFARTAIDERNRLLVVHASETEIDAVRQLVQQIDKPARSLTASFYFIRVRVGTPDDSSDDRLPEALALVANTLRESGFGSMSLMAPVIVTVDEGHSFEQESILNTNNDEGVGDHLMFLVEGIAHLDTDQDIVQMNVQALTKGEYTTPEYAEGRTEFAVTTTVAMELDSYVILAAAPASTSDGDSIAVAVHVSRN